MSGRVHVLYTGGTIGMTPSDAGYAPVPGAFGAMLDRLIASDRDALPPFSVTERDPILDSANMRPSDWNDIARDIAEVYDDFDGFVVLHGTDTMAYTASALSFALEGLRKPVVVTGSQIPLFRPRNDARRNLIDALLVAADFSIPEVCLSFGGRIMRGNRATKVSARSLDAFDSPNYPLLGRSDVTIRIDTSVVRSSPRGPLQVRTLTEPRVQALRLFPGVSADVLRNILRPPLQGLVLECYGVGNAPVRDGALVEVLQDACDRGVVVVACSQCREGTVDLSGYATGAALARAGVVGAMDMTPEAAMTKLMYLIERGLEPADVRRLVQRNLRGELTPVDTEAT